MKTENPTVINDDDVYWEMTWGPQFPEKPPTEIMFEEGPALARLLASEVIFLNDHWWMKDWPEDARKVTSLNVNCNDIFAWGCADAEELDYRGLQELYDYWLKDPTFGPAVWCIKKRNELPQAPVRKAIHEAGIWNLDEMNLEPNFYDAAIQKQKEETT